MTIAGRDPHEPLRLLWLFARSLAASALIAGAVYAALYVVRDMRRAPAVAPQAPAQGFSLPGGLELLTPLADARQFQQFVGFAPVLPRALPQGTAATPRFDATQPDAAGARKGEIRFPAQTAAGPTVLLVESRAQPAAPPASAPRTVAPRTLAGTVRCGGVTVDARLYFPVSTTEASALAAAQRFIDALAAQCAAP
ncbi:MAG: hypothetical protein KGK07_07575 [Chloroflexota bacterium]|nr:hypothetical protein [Chloroflexota bacterium]